ncbi:MAG: fimbrial protein [Scandinavium sp.]|uniref:fimbrial protein n=1 Tax=Scandinavium sp. TaxID=2830653 RepID=UPI003F3827D7
MGKNTRHQKSGGSKCVKLMMLIANLTAALFCYNAHAVVNCSSNYSSLTRSLSTTLNITQTYAPDDLPVGSVIYHAKIPQSIPVTIKCNAGSYSMGSFISALSYGHFDQEKIMSTPYGTGTVFATNIAGIGAAIVISHPGQSDYHLVGNNDASLPWLDFTQTNPTIKLQIDFLLIKTGSVPSDAVFTGADFPQLDWLINTRPEDNYNLTGLGRLTYFFNGSIHFISQTCTTPDLTVNMGSYNNEEIFTAIGDHTPWVDSSIELKNCPKFSGYFTTNSFQTINDSTSDDAGTNSNQSDTVTPSGGSRELNMLTVSLAPTTSVSNGIISLTSLENSATGVGLQLGYTPGNVDSVATSPSKLWKSGDIWSVAAPTDGRSTVKIPLAARYYQKDTTVTPGHANAQVVFNINYK